ncbi:MAG: dual specificity protein phosphatase family protein [Chloroflexi bacterium]|nr:dual specificity protein phosphatase family protein [Chloroflexota bacterium]
MARKSAYPPHPRRITLEYNLITEHIYLGTNQCCRAHFEESLLKAGVMADISLEHEHLDTPFGVDFFLWLPVVDKQPPSQQQLLVGARTIKDLVDNNIKVYVHCKRGHQRGPTLVAAYFILEGLGPRSAIKRVRDKRMIHLTRGQMKALSKFSRLVAHK